MGEKSKYVEIARESLQYYLKNHKYLEIEEKSNRRNGVFVSLKKNGILRGCIGTISPVMESIEEEIIRNAVEAGLHDPRFYPVMEEEMDDIDISVDVLSDSFPSSFEELEPMTKGIIVTSGSKRGLLLPNLEGISTPEEQLEIVLKKAGIKPFEDYSIEVFTVERFK
ncbi:MAG: AmmeMemoRadiSam system protein A [Firmicutes bacterium]|jgi:AmmeMemoRadiSam system protein A|nr:AmmeMemoRadiSam system protein A [Bacillota bacterium]